MATVKIFCDCGKEIWQDIDERYTLKYIKDRAICADCIIKQDKEEKMKTNCPICDAGIKSTPYNYRQKEKKYQVEEILRLIPDEVNKALRCSVDGDMVKIATLRLVTFRNKGIKCTSCKVEALYFLKDKSDGQYTPHLNLYGVDYEGNRILFTKDHIIPKSLGGKDYINNMRTMCAPCNEFKNNSLI